MQGVYSIGGNGENSENFQGNFPEIPRVSGDGSSTKSDIFKFSSEK